MRVLRTGGGEYTYVRPVMKREVIGQKPRSVFQADAASAPPPQALENVWADVPVLEGDGSVKMEQVTTGLELNTKRPLERAAILGGLASLAGMAYNGAAHTLGALPTLPAAGLVAVAGLGAIVGGIHAAHNPPTLVLDEHPILNPKFLGHEISLENASLEGISGVLHRSMPRIEKESLGTFTTPRVVFPGEGAGAQKTQLLNSKTSSNRGVESDTVYEVPVMVTSEIGNGVSALEPVRERDGSIRTEVIRERVEAKPYSVPLFAAAGGVIGGGVGFGLGSTMASFVGIPSGVASALGVGLGATLGALGAGGFAANDTTSIEWQNLPITSERLTSTTQIVPTSRKESILQGRVGPHRVHLFRNVPDSRIETSTKREVVSEGTYFAPRVVHRQKSLFARSESPDREFE